MTSRAFTSSPVPDATSGRAYDGNDAVLLDAVTVRELQDRCRDFGVDADHLVLSAWLLLLHQLADKDELAVQVRDGHGFTHVSRLDPRMPWSAFASRTRDSLSESACTASCGATDDAPVDEVLLHGCTTEFSIGVPHEPARRDRGPHLRVHRCDRGDQGWSLHIATTLRQALAARHLALWQSMIHALIASPGAPLGTVSAIAPPERERIIGCFNDTARAYPADQTIVSLVAALARENPSRIALRDDRVSLSREELLQQACRLARHLVAMGVGKGQVVVLLMERDASMVVATLAVLIAGGVYCPIDPSYPEARVRHYLEDTGASVLLVSGDAARALSHRFVGDGGFAGRVVPADHDSLLALPPTVAADLAVGSSSKPDDPAYIMYTSGTTGKPKGVPVTQRGVVRLVRDTDYVQLDQDTRMLQSGAIGFDAATFEIWGALLNGGELHVIDREALIDRRGFERFVNRHRPNSALITSSLFAMMANEFPEVFLGFRLIVVGGDVVPAKQVQSVRRLCPGLAIVNAYGPTENAVISTAHVVTDDDGLDIPIGGPIANTTTYVFSRHGQLQPIGVPGELFVGGAGIGPGYLNNPEQTAASFVTVAATGNQRLYRTGDIVSWREDGSLHFVGRRDNQIKIRGLRVEIGEIERQLLSIPDIKEAVVLCRKIGAQRDPVLDAHVTAAVALDLIALRRALQAVLPPHMVPAHVDQLDTMPLTPNGKVDRQALSARAAARASKTLQRSCVGASDSNDARTGFVGHVIEELARLLGRTDLRPVDNFLALGGSSLTAALLASRLEAACRRRCATGVILDSNSLADIASALDAAEAITAHEAAGEAPSLATGNSPRPASIGQKQIFIEQSKFPESTAYNLPLEITLRRGSIDEARLRRALQRVIDRHETMRTVFAMEGGALVRRVLPRVEAEIDVIDGSVTATAHASGPDVREDEAAQWIRPFDLGLAPPWRVALLHMPDGTRILCDFHHILVDGTSIAVLLGDWSDAYDALDEGDEDPRAAVPFDRHVEWETRGGGARRIERNKAFWHDVFAGSRPAADLPTDRRRAPMRDWRGDSCRFSLGADLTARVDRCARRLKITPYSVLLCAYALWLATVTGDCRPVVGTAAAGRSMPGSERIAGMFVNTVCLPLDIGPDVHSLSVAEWLGRSARHIRNCLDHQDCPFIWLAETFAPDRGFQRHPLFDSMFTMQNTGMSDRRYFGAPVRWRPEFTRASLFDLNLQIESEDDELSAIWTYSTQLFDRCTLERFAGDWLSIIEQLIRDETRRMSSLLADPAIGLLEGAAPVRASLPLISFAL